MTGRKKRVFEIDPVLMEKGISVWNETYHSIPESFLKIKVKEILDSEKQKKEDEDGSKEFLVKKTESKKIKGNLIVVYSKFSSASDITEIINYEEDIKNEFLMYESFFKIHCYNVFFNENIEDLVLSFKGKPFFVFFLRNNLISDIKDIINFCIKNKGFLYSEKNYRSKKIKFFEFERKAFLVSEKQEKF